jgi:hypothetical protein
MSTTTLATALSVTTGRMLTDPDPVLALTDELGGRRADAAAAVLAQHPGLRDADPPTDPAGIGRWLDRMEQEHGRTLTIETRP